MNVQIIRSPNGDELVVLPKADYDALVAGQYGEAAEDAADAAMFDTVMAELANAHNGILPEEVSRHMMGGNRLPKALRIWRGFSQVELAERAGIGQSYLSEIESGRKVGSEDTIRAIAKALDVPVEWIA